MSKCKQHIAIGFCVVTIPAEWKEEGKGQGDTAQQIPKLLVFLFLLLLMMCSSDVWAQGELVCGAQRLEQATTAYMFGNVGHTLNLLRPCLPDGFQDKTLRASGCRLMALSYIAVDSVDVAGEWVDLMLDIDSRFRTDEQVDPLAFIDMVEQMRPRWYTWLWRGNEWYKWAGRGLVVGGVASIPLLLKNTPEPDLPDPPIFPNN